MWAKWGNIFRRLRLSEQIRRRGSCKPIFQPNIYYKSNANSTRHILRRFIQMEVCFHALTDNYICIFLLKTQHILFICVYLLFQLSVLLFILVRHPAFGRSFPTFNRICLHSPSFLNISLSQNPERRSIR